MAFEFDRSILGNEFDHTVVPAVTAAQIREYAAASLETNPRYTTVPDCELVAPPTFVVSVRGDRMMPEKLAAALGPRRGGLEAGKDIQFGVPVRPGDVLAARSTVHDVYEKTGRTGPMLFIVLRRVITNQRGESVAVIDQKMMMYRS